MEMNFLPTNPDEIKYTLQITMTLKDWKKLQNQLSRDYPSWKLGSEITDMVWQAETTFYPQTKESGRKP